MKKSLGLVFSGLWLAAPLAMAQTAAPESSDAATLSQARAAQEAAPTSALNSALFLQLIVGEITLQEDEPAAGFALILDAARKTGDPQLFQRATDIALQSRSGDAALQAARAWKQEQPASREANRYLLQILVALNRIPETLEPLKAELALSSDVERPQVIGAVPTIYARIKDAPASAAVVEQALADYLKSDKPVVVAASWTTVARMRLAASDAPGAMDAATRAQAADATAIGPVLVALELIEAKQPQAEPMVKKYLEGNPKTAPEIRLAYTQALLNTERYAEATAQLQRLTQEQPEFSAAWLMLGSLQLQDNQLDLSKASFEKHVALAEKETAQPERSRRLAQAYLSLAQIAEKNKDYTGAEAWLKKIQSPTELSRAQMRRASILASQGNITGARALIQQLPERNPEELRLKLNAEVSLLRDAKQFQLAHDVLAKAIAQSPEDTELLYEQAMVAEKLNQLDEMEKLLRQAIAIKPDFYGAYNALGYSLADRNIRVAEARDLIKKALEFAPGDPFIQDSLGWAEFRLGNKEEAVRIFEAAYKAKPDAEIAAHYGEVLMSLGQRDRAVAIFKEGRLLNADNDTLVDTLKRLNVAL